MKNAPDFLLAFREDITSQYGEDGIIAKIFEIIGTDSTWCVELGALNGTHDSNVWRLIEERGWKGALIEAEPDAFKKLQETHAKHPDTVCINSYVSFEGETMLDTLLAATPIPETFDLCSLDIDGNEYHVWESLVRYRPRVMVVEFNPSIPNSVAFVQPRDMRVFQGSSLSAFVELGKRKGYELVAANETNAFFVLRDLFPKFEMDNASLDAVHPDRSFETQLYQLYDGTVGLAGNTKLIWHGGREMDVARMQPLTAAERKYPARIAGSAHVRRMKQWARALPIYGMVQRLRAWLRSR